MNLADASALDNGSGVMVIDAAAGHDNDAAAGQLGELGNRFGALQALLFAARGKKTVGAGGANVFERLEQIGGHIEGAMKGDVERARQLDQLASGVDIDVALGIQHAENDAVDA